jgi:hypothetical protein
MQLAGCWQAIGHLRITSLDPAGIIGGVRL